MVSLSPCPSSSPLSSSSSSSSSSPSSSSLHTTAPDTINIIMIEAGVTITPTATITATTTEATFSSSSSSSSTFTSSISYRKGLRKRKRIRSARTTRTRTTPSSLLTSSSSSILLLSNILSSIRISIRITITMTMAMTILLSLLLFDCDGVDGFQYQRQQHQQQHQMRMSSFSSSSLLLSRPASPLFWIPPLLSSPSSSSSATILMSSRLSASSSSSLSSSSTATSVIAATTTSTSTSTSTSTTTNRKTKMTMKIPERRELESMRVVELKQFIKDSGLNERGLLSKLKRKEELISFLINAEKKIRSNMEMENKNRNRKNQEEVDEEEDTDTEVGRKENAVPSFNEKEDDNNNDDDNIFLSQLFVPIRTNKEIMSSTNQMWSQNLADFLIVADDEEKMNTNMNIKKKKSNIDQEEEEKKMDALLTPSNYEDNDDDNFLSNLFVDPKPNNKSEISSSSMIEVVKPKQQSVIIDATTGTTLSSSSSTIEVVKPKTKLQVKPKQRKPLGMPPSSANGSSNRSKKHAYNEDYIETTNAAPSTIITTKAKEKQLSEVIREAKVVSVTTQQYQNPNTFLSKLYDEVAEVYPTLPYLREGNTTCVGELDVRQQYHPMLVYERKKRSENSSDDNKDDKEDVDDSDDNEEEKKAVTEITPLSGDMDLIFIGTASCTPSMTRGVSCTALRLHSLAGGTGIAHGKSESRYVRRKNQKHTGENEKDHRAQSQQQQQQQFDVRSTSSSSNLGTWLFDCGEATQLQIQRTSAIRPSKITKIFVTHAHGDHSFGLPGLLCLMGQDTAGGNEQANTGNANVRKTKFSKPPIDIYGPEGLRVWLRVAIRYSVSRIVPRYRVHELKDVAMAPEWGYSDKWEKYFYNKTAFYERHKERQKSTSYTPTSQWGRANQQRLASFRRKNTSSDWVTHCEAQAQSASELPFLAPSSLYGEVSGGRDIYPSQDHPLSNDGAPIWEVIDGKDDNIDNDESGSSDDDGAGVRVYAGPMSHGVPCVGYVIQEPNRPGRLRDEYVKPICQRNIPALKKAGFQHPMKALAVIKNLPSGGSFTFPDGTIVTQEEAVEPNRPGRKVVICGDTNSSRSLDKIARNADVVVHEATNTFLHALDHKDANLRSVSREAIFHGHSTPQMAGDFCQRIHAKRLILNHFSARYTGDQSMESISIMTRIEQQAIKASGLSRANVAAAWDFMIFPIPKVKDTTTSVGGDGNSDDDDDDDE